MEILQQEKKYSNCSNLPVLTLKMRENDEKSVRIVDLYPNEDEILNPSVKTHCQHCQKNFQNSSACRLHTIKVHKIMDKTRITDHRISDRLSEEVKLRYHCPVASCSNSNTPKQFFKEFRYLKQHFVRLHTEKKFICECGYRTSLEKDIKYHRKVRCTLLKKNQQKKNPKKATIEKSVEIESAVPNQNPIFVIVAADNVNSVIEKIQMGFGASTSDIAIQTVQNGIQFVNSSTSTNQMSYVHNEPHLNEYNQNFCNRSTGMDDMYNYYPQDYPTNMVDQHNMEKPNEFDFDVHHQNPQTRSLGTATMFDSVSTRHMGTSMNDEEFISLYLRDIETQTPNVQNLSTE